MKIKKAVIPIAGKGTRFLPATKQIPKEMIPLHKYPMLHYVVEEAIQSGIEQIIFITSYGKSSIEDYFDRNFELESFLEKNNKLEELKLVQEIGKKVEIISVRQKEQLGLGHAINCAAPLFRDGEKFACLLGDDIVLSSNPGTKQLMEVSNSQNGSSVIGVMEVPKEDTEKYGIVDGDYIANDSMTLKMKRMLEKPLPKDAPTNLATPGRYILSSSIFNYLDKIDRGVGGEYQLTDAINLMAQEESVFAHKFEGERYDTGSMEGYLDATMALALRDEETSSYMKSLIRKYYEKHC